MSYALLPPSGLPRLRLVLAVSLDGRLAPPEGGAAQIGGRGDRRVLEEALAWADAALLGAETLRRHGSTCLIHAPDLLGQRHKQGRSPQPLALVASRSGRLPAELPFFRQPLERWLLLARDAAEPDAAPVDAQGDAAGAGPPAGRVAASEKWSPPAAGSPSDPVGFSRRLPFSAWEPVLRQLAAAGLERIVVLGGAALAASLLAEDRLAELQLTLCPRLLGGEHGWLGPGVVVPAAARQGWQLLEQRCLEGEELLLRYGRGPRPV